MDPALVDALRNSRLAVELTDEQTRSLAERFSFRNLNQGDVLVPEGASDSHLYVIVSGAISIVMNAGTTEAVTLITLTQGDLVGELSFLDETKHYGTLVAEGPTRVLGLEREDLEALLPVEPQLVYRAMRAVVRTVHAFQRRLLMQSVELANYMYKQHGRY